jgi:hypothetical protein
VTVPGRTTARSDKVFDFLPGEGYLLGRPDLYGGVLTIVGPGDAGKTRFSIEFDLPPMDEPEAVALFIERSRAVRSAVDDSPAVHELIRRLDGLPLDKSKSGATRRARRPVAKSRLQATDLQARHEKSPAGGKVGPCLRVPRIRLLGPTVESTFRVGNKQHRGAGNPAVSDARHGT